MSDTAEVSVPWHVADRGFVLVPEVGAIRLSWKPFGAVSAYEVHGVQGRRENWSPNSATLLSVTTGTRFVHRGLGPRSGTWSYRIIAVTSHGEHLMTTIAVASSRTSVTVTGRPVAVVGAFDGNGLDLAISTSGFVHYRTTFPADVDFRYGFDRPDRRWSYVQPGPEDAWAGRRSHRFRLRFDLDEIPTDDLDLALWLVDRHPTRAGSASIEVNGQALESLLFDETIGEVHASLVVPGSGAGPAHFETAVPRGALRLGENVLDIAKDHGSWIAYDAVGIFAR